jgi:hypothetical protein
MRISTRLPGLLAALLWIPALSGEESILTEALPLAEINASPYRYNGLMYVRGALGSAVMVGAGVYATAAHVIFDEEQLAWISRDSTQLFPRHHQRVANTPQGGLKPVAYRRWTSYATRVEEDDSGPGLSTPDTFNIDFAVGYISTVTSDHRILAYPEVHVDQPEAVSILREDRPKTIVGYPADGDFIPPADIGLMHATAPGDYFCWWSGLEDFPNTWRDSEDIWVATYEFEGVTTHSGNSGGPIFVQDDAGQWVLGGLLVGSIGSSSVLVRGIDENAWQLIESAARARSSSGLWRADELAAEVTPEGVALSWNDRSTNETGYFVERLDRGEWEWIASLPANAQSHLDASAMPGRVYAYRVQPEDASGNRSPKSVAARVAIPGRDHAIGELLGQRWLGFASAGESNWHGDGDGRLRAGKVRPLGASSLRLDLIGPGTLQFTWGVSSELNPDFDDPGSPNRGEVYDAVWLRLNGEPVDSGDGPVFLSGIGLSESRSLEIPAGPHSVEWVYEKDPYSTEGEDTAFLDSLSWTPGPDSPYPVLGGFVDGGANAHAATWFGRYNVAAAPWVRHDPLGWIYLRQGDGNSLTAHLRAPGMGEFHTTPEIFPYLYLYAARKWVYWVAASGADGRALWFYDLEQGAFFQVN